MVLLSKAERDYLAAKRQFNEDYSYTIKCRLVKKLNKFTNEEMPLLLAKGYLTEFRKLTENCNDNDNDNNIIKGDRGAVKPPSQGTGPRGFDPLTCGSLHHSNNSTDCRGSEDRRDILTTLRAQAC
jgi:hypothetical protein